MAILHIIDKDPGRDLMVFHCSSTDISCDEMSASDGNATKNDSGTDVEEQTEAEGTVLTSETKRRRRRRRCRRRKNGEDRKNESCSVHKNYTLSEHISSVLQTKYNKNFESGRNEKNSFKKEKQQPQRSVKKRTVPQFGLKYDSLTSVPVDELEKKKYVAMDCEMVGIGQDGKQSMLARVTIVDWDGNVLIDRYIRPSSGVTGTMTINDCISTKNESFIDPNDIDIVTDFRTEVSGITREMLYENDDAIDISTCRQLVLDLLTLDNNDCSDDSHIICHSNNNDKKKILIGHGLKNDLSALGIQHPWHLTRDTTKYEPFMKALPSPLSSLNSTSLDSSESCQLRSNSGNCGNVSDDEVSYNSALTVTTTSSSSSENENKFTSQQSKKQNLVPRKLRDLCHERLGMEIQQKQHSSYEDAVAALKLYQSVRHQWEKVMEYKIKKTAQIIASASVSSSSPSTHTE